MSITWKILACKTGVQYEIEDRGCYSRGIAKGSVPAGELLPGRELLEDELWHARVVAFDGKKLTFRYKEQDITIGPEDIWASSFVSVPAVYVHESQGLMVWLEAVPAEEADPEMVFNRLTELLSQMRENAGEGRQWKNIPIAREYLGLLKNACDGVLGREDIMFACDAIFNEDLLFEHDVPRLCRSFLMLHTLTFHKPDDGHKYDEGILSVMDLGKIRTRLDMYVRPNTRMDRMEWYVENTGASLKFDPIEMTPLWEEMVYEVEAECERRLEGQRRGMGYCYNYWSCKKEVLAERGIEWHSPKDMNPRVHFD